MNRRYALAFLCCAVAAPAMAQEQPPATRPGFYTTKDAAPPGGTLPWLNQQGGQTGGQPPANYIPFQHATPYGTQAVPAPLPMERSVPVENVEGIAVTQPAAPAAPRVEANPAAEDPTAPTDLNAPLFSADPDTKTPREIVLRVLNKVTAHAEEIHAKPGDIIASGKLVIEAVQCYRSAPTSQSDSVALLSISEKLPTQEKPRLLFHGWMYVSSPSLTALEHPIYDVTMVDCAMKAPPPEAKKDADGDAKKKPEKSKKKAG